MGNAQPTLSAQMQRDGVQIPQNLAVQPTIKVDLLCYLDAFYELDTERAHGVALVRIPGSAIRAYAREYGFNRDELVYFIRQMDDAHLARLTLEAGNKDGGSGGTRTVVQRPPRPD